MSWVAVASLAAGTLSLILALFLGYGLARARRRARQLEGRLDAEREHAAAIERARIDLVANLAHEIATPLAAVRGYVETLRDGAHAPEDAPRFLDVSLRNVERLERLVRGVSNLAEIERGALAIANSPTPLAPAIELAVATLAPRAAEKGVGLTSSAPGGGVALADADRLTQVLVNLIDNAVKFTPAGGKVTVSTGREAERVAVTVRDDGPGIDREALPRVTERFYRADRSRARGAEPAGFGLGLAIAKHLVEAMGGELAIESELGAGTEVTVRLPAAG